MRKYLANLIYVLSNILFTVAGFAWSTRILGPELIGKAQFVLTFAQYFVLIAALGIPIYGVVEVAKVVGDREKLSKLFSELVLINLITTGTMLLFYLVTISVVGRFQEDYTLFLIGGGLVFISFSTIEWFYTGSEQFRFLAIRSVVIKSASLVALFLFVRTVDDLLIYLLINVLTVVATNIWYLLNLRGQVTLWFRNLDLKRHLPALLLIFSTTLTISVYTVVDVLLVGFLADDEAVGLYTTAVKLNKMLIPIIFSLATVLIPGISRTIADKDTISLMKLMDRSFAFICLLGIPVSAGLLVFAPEFLYVFTGPQYSGAIPAMQITASLSFILGLGNLFGLQLLIPGGFRKQYLIATLFGVGISLVLNIILIGPFRETGAAVAMMAAETAVTLVTWYYVRKNFTLSFNWMLALKSIGTCLLFLPVAWILRSWDTTPLIRLIFAVGLCAGSYFIVQLFIFREKHINDLYKDFLCRFRSR